MKPEALVERARKKATAGKREEVFHPIDTRLSADPANEAATALRIVVHESHLEVGGHGRRPR